MTRSRSRSRPRRAPLALAAALAILSTACGSDGGAEAPRVPYEGDAILLQEVLDGRMTADEGLRRIGESRGFPVATSQGFVFALRDDQGLGPWRVEPAGSSAFPATELTSHAGVAFAVVPIAAPEGVAYRFVTRFGDATNDPRGRYLDYEGGRERTLVRPAGPHVERWPWLMGDPAGAAGDRKLRVWVPAEPPTHFLYAQDGQNLFSPQALFGGWRLQDAAGPRTLIVGVDNTPARLDEYTHVPDDLGSGPVGGDAERYVDYLESFVRPFVEARYGTPARVGIVGSSLGGLVAYYAALRRPAAYDFVASLSGTMGWGSIGPSHTQTIAQAYAALPACPDVRFYLDSGGQGAACADLDSDGVQDDVEGGDNYCENVQLRDVLAALGCADVHYVWAEDAQHDESAWRARSPAILDLFEAL